MSEQSKLWLPLVMAGLVICAPAQQPHKQQPAPASKVQEGQRSKPGEWLRKYKDVPPAEQEKALESDPNFKNLPKERQEQLRQRLRQFDNLPPAGKARIINHMQAFEQLTPEQRQQARELQQRFRDLPTERRQQVRAELRSLRAMSPDQRQEELNSDHYRTTFTDNERDVMQKILQLPTPAKNPRQR